MGPVAPRPLRRDLWMPCDDGIRLATRVWTPPGQGPWPLLLMRQPYGRAIASTVTYAHPRWYAERGFLVVVQDVRGRGDSEGDFGGFAQEAADTAAAVRWCRRLEAGNGRVGSYGFSYQGLSQLLNVAQAPGPGEDAADPLPDCLAPAMCGVDERLHWAGEGGAHWWSLGLGWGLQLAAEGCRRRGDREGWRQIRRSLESGAYLEEGLELLQRHDPAGMGLVWLRLDPADPAGWRVHTPSEALLRRPMLLIGGWHDPHLNGVLDLAGRSLAAGGRPRLCIGAWSHLDWQGGIDRLQLAFFRRHLGGAAGAAQSPAAAVSSGQPPVGNADAQPDPVTEQRPSGHVAAAPAGLQSQPAPGEWNWSCGPMLQCPRSGRWDSDISGDFQARQGWVLASDGLAAIRPDEGRLLPCPLPAGAAPAGGGLTLVHDPWRPVPSRGGHLGPTPGLVERGDLDGRADVACFQTQPLQQPLRLCGRPRLRLEAAADQPGFDLWACLSLVQADRRVLQLSTGVLRVMGERALALQPLVLELQPLALELAPGEVLRLSLAGAAWPAIAVNPGDGTPPRGGSGPDHRIISIDLSLTATRLWLEPLLDPRIGAN